jgi:steroid delta-isomerase-like uncharacterized protein
MFRLPIYPVIVLLLLSCTGNDGQKDRDEKNQLNAMALVEKGWNEKNLNSVEPYLSDNFNRRVNSINLANNKSELAANMKVYFDGFPDLEIKIDHILSSDNQVYMNWTATGTNTGSFGGVKATGKKIEISGASRIEFDQQGKIVYEEVVFNELSLLQQMGHTLSPPIVE